MHDYVLCRYCGKHFYTDENEATGCSFHSKLPVLIGDTGPRADYADLWTFPCCSKTVKAEIVAGRDVKPAQTPGCVTSRHVQETGWEVFISYARPDESMAVTLENELRRRGHRVWRDRSDITPSTTWADAIDRAIADTTHVILVLTSRAVASVQVNRELDLALDAGKNVVPILFEQCKIPKPITALQAIDWRKIKFGPVFFATDGFYQLRQAVVFGSHGLWAQANEAGPIQNQVESDNSAPTTRQRVILKDTDGDTVAEIRPLKRYKWLKGHLACADGVVYVVIDVLQYSRSSVEIRVQRARIPVDMPTAVDERSNGDLSGLRRRNRWFVRRLRS